MTLQIQQAMNEIARLRDGFHRAVFVDHDVEAALATVHPECTFSTVTGPQVGAPELRRYLAEDVLPHLPPDLTFTRVSRTTDQRRMVDERTVGFTHDRELPWLLPGVAATHRRAEVLAISIVTVRHTSHHGVVDSRIAGHRTLWDHLGLRTQLRLPS